MPDPKIVKFGDFFPDRIFKNFSGCGIRHGFLKIYPHITSGIVYFFLLHGQGSWRPKKRGGNIFVLSNFYPDSDQAPLGLGKFYPDIYITQGFSQNFLQIRDPAEGSIEEIIQFIISWPITSPLCLSRDQAVTQGRGASLVSQNLFLPVKTKAWK